MTIPNIVQSVKMFELSDSYPYPVLYFGNDDYNSTFEVEIDQVKEFDSIKLNIQFKLNDSIIQQLINKEKQVI